MSEIYDFLKTCGVFFVTTINGTTPAARPFGAVMEYEGHLSISTSNQKDVYKQLHDHPEIQIIALKKETREWMRINGTAVETKSFTEKKAMLEECPLLRKRFDSEYAEHYALFQITELTTYLHHDNGVRKIGG